MKISKIKVLSFEQSMAAQLKLAENFANSNVIELVAMIPSFVDFAKNSEDQIRAKIGAQPIDVIVIDICSSLDNYEKYIEKLKTILPAQYIGFSSIPLTKENAQKAGLYCFQNKPGSGGISEEDAYAALIYSIKNARLSASVKKAGFNGIWREFPNKPSVVGAKIEMITIGASAGGTDAIMDVLKDIPKDAPCVLIVQHMPKDFVELFASHVNDKCALNVKCAKGGELVENGMAYIASNDKHMEIVKIGDNFYINCTYKDKISGHRPSVDALFKSVAKVAGAHAIGVILTGMGKDGVEGLLDMNRAGAYTIGQDEETSVVYGMPQAAFQMGAVTKQLPLNRIGEEIVRKIHEYR